MDYKFQGQVALVTGAGSQIGFGKEIALALAKEGIEAVGITDINLEDAKLTEAAVKEAGVKCLAVKADVTNQDDVKAMVKQIADEFGKIDILFNVAGGIAGGGPLEEQGRGLWEKEMALNLYNPMLVAGAVLPYMKKQGKGSIVNIGSGSAYKYSMGVSTYAQAKAAVDIFTKQLALAEAANNIRVNCVSPGPAPTNFIKVENKEEVVAMMAKTIPLGRPTSAQDIMYAALFFASDMACDISGQVLQVSGADII